MTPANTSLFTPQTTGGSSFFTGAYVADLRGLNGFFGTRTLTLIDGRRAVPTNTGDSFDLNLIPGVLLQRIDTVTGGASAAYAPARSAVSSISSSTINWKAANSMPTSMTPTTATPEIDMSAPRTVMACSIIECTS